MCVWHVEGPRGQEACVSKCENHESVSVDHLALCVKDVIPAVVTDTVRSMSYVMILDLVPTNVRLHSINLMQTDIYGETDTLMHNPAECGANVGIWTT